MPQVVEAERREARPRHGLREDPVAEVAPSDGPAAGIGEHEIVRSGLDYADALSGYAVGKLALVDPDRLLQHNLVRHRARAEDLGRYKVNATAEWLRMRNPQLKVTTYPLDVIDQTDRMRPLFAHSEVIV